MKKKKIKVCDTRANSWVRMTCNSVKLTAKTWCTCKAEGLGDLAGASTIHADMQSNENDPKNVKMCQVGPRVQNSPVGHEIVCLH